MRTSSLHRLREASSSATQGLAACLALVMIRLTRRLQLRSERGDVPGWVMVTLMSALLVAAVYAVAGDALVDMFDNAIKKVGGMDK